MFRTNSHSTMPRKPAKKKSPKKQRKPASATKKRKAPAKKSLGQTKKARAANKAEVAARISDAQIRTRVRQCVSNSPPQKPFTDNDTLSALQKNVQSVKSCVNASCNVSINVTGGDNVNSISAKVKLAQG